MLTLDDRLEIVERVWPGTRAKGWIEVSNHLVALSAIEEGKAGWATPAEVERARALLLERMRTDSTEPSTSARHGAASTSAAHEPEGTR